MRVRLLLGAALLLFAAAAAEAERTFVIQRFDATIDVSADGSVMVEELIVPRFTGSWNGIFRSIPVQYRTPQGLNYTLRVTIESVTDGSGAPLRHETSRERHYLKVKVWVPGATDTTRTVKLRYRVDNGLRFFEEHDELYWNVTGDEWEVPIEGASALIRLPAGVSGVRATAFRGAYGSTDRASATVGAEGVRVDAESGLNFREGLTAVVGWNPGVVDRPNAIESAGGMVYSNLPLAIPPIVFIGMFLLWRARGRDPKPAAIVTQYEPPPHMTPAELGTLVDGKPDMRDITATIVDLAVRGYLHIDETKDDGFFGFFGATEYTFRLTKPRDEWRTLKAHERDLLQAMFAHETDSVSLSTLKNKFYKHLPGLREELYRDLIDDGLYVSRPDRVRMLYIVAGAGAFILLEWMSGAAMASLGMQPLAGIAAGILSGLIIVFFGWFMPARTMRGARELEKVLGFQEFLSRVEADRMERTIRTPAMFEKFLPYAMALGVEENWAQAFEGIYQQAPQWYSGPGGPNAFHPRVFTGNMGRLSAAAASTMASSPRSSSGSGFSGGSSGGGFGGGGGGGF